MTDLVAGLAMRRMSATRLSNGYVMSVGLKATGLRFTGLRTNLNDGGTLMGLDFEIQGLGFEDGPSWTYSGFNRFREAIAAEIGVDLFDMEGFSGVTRWDAFDSDPICILLNHSDCDGKILPDDCERIAPRLKELMFVFDEDSWDYESGHKLVDMLTTCVKFDRPLRFC